MNLNNKRKLKSMIIAGVSLLSLSIGALPAYADALHNIVPGDSLYKIAINNDVSVNELKQANGMSGDVIYSGDKLDIPDVAAQTVKAQTATTQIPQNINSKDMELLARLITAEAGAEPFEGKVAVAAVILNRTNDLKFPATIAGNIFKPHEFESVSNGLIWGQPSDDAYKAAEAALKGWDPTNGAKYFFNPAKAQGGSWVWTRTIIDRIGGHVFAI